MQNFCNLIRKKNQNQKHQTKTKMIQLKINNHSRRLATDWKDVTIKQAIEINSLKLPDHISTVEDIADPASWVMSTEAIKYASRVFAILSGFTLQDIEKTNAYDIIAYFNKYLIPIVTDLHTIEPVTYKAEGIKTFELNGVTYKLPESLLIDQTWLPLHSSTAIEFTESSNIMALMADMGREGIRHLPLFIATYCRPEGEKFSEVTIQKRAVEFQQLPMSVAWEVFFCIRQLIIIFTLNSLNYTKKQIVKYNQQLRVQAWIESVSHRGFIRWLNHKFTGQLTSLN